MEEHRILMPNTKKMKYQEHVQAKPPITRLHCTVNGVTYYRDEFQTEEAWREATRAPGFRRESEIAPKGMPRKKSSAEKAIEMGMLYGMGPAILSELEDSQSDRIFKELLDADFLAES